MKTIWKVPLVADNRVCHLPAGAKPLHAGPDPSGKPCVWFEVDTKANGSTHQLYVIGTGDQIPNDTTYVGTINVTPWMWHIYWKENK